MKISPHTQGFLILAGLGVALGGLLIALVHALDYVASGWLLY